MSHVREQSKKTRRNERATNRRFLRDIQHHSGVNHKSPDVESFHPPWRPLSNQYHTDMKFVYLIPLHGGIWNLCLTLNGSFFFRFRLFSDLISLFECSFQPTPTEQRRKFKLKVDKMFVSMSFGWGTSIEVVWFWRSWEFPSVTWFRFMMKSPVKTWAWIACCFLWEWVTVKGSLRRKPFQSLWSDAFSQSKRKSFSLYYQPSSKHLDYKNLKKD